MKSYATTLWQLLRNGTTLVVSICLLACGTNSWAQHWPDPPTVSVPAPIVPPPGLPMNSVAPPPMRTAALPYMPSPAPQPPAYPPQNRVDPLVTAWAPPPAYGAAPSAPVVPAAYPRELHSAPWSQEPWANQQQRVNQAINANYPLPSAKPRRGREGIFQRLSFNSTYLPGNDVSDFGVTSLDFALTLAFPFPSRDMPLIVKPGFETHFLEGPSSPDLPARLYDGTLQFRTMTKLNDCWGIDVAVTPGWHSDFQTSNDEALRITGHAFAAWDSSPTLQWIFGVVYLDRNDFSVLPAVGLIWKPNEFQRLELTFPRPRYLVQLSNDGTTETWAYLAGEFGSGTWAIERADTSQDVITYSDYRIVLGWERKCRGGVGVKLETAYVFGRNIEYDSATPDFKPGDTLMVRAGFFY